MNFRGVGINSLIKEKPPPHKLSYTANFQYIGQLPRMGEGKGNVSSGGGGEEI